MAAGYASARPAVHPRIIDRIRRRIPHVRTAADIGCGSGLSTLALEPVADHTVGIEPSVEMLRLARTVAPGACFAAGRAEDIPLRYGSVDLMTAAGSLNWADLSRFYPEAKRVLSSSGALVVYDFSTGRSFRDSGSALDDWFDGFETRYPWPPAAEITPETLQPEPWGLRLTSAERFEEALRIEPEFYLRYVMTETNVVAAIDRGTPESEIRSWCKDTLAPVFGGVPRDVVFRGFLAYIDPL